MIRFGSVCSGIEAASVAWSPLGWRAAWLAEIEPFPSAVLAHHYPDVPNLGDMMALPGRIASGDVEAPDVFCGGTPCQAFSVAGLRKSLDDARGNLSLTFCEIANAIDTRRAARGQQPAIVFWENVPGVLSTKDNAFGCFLAGLAGEDGALEPPGGKWSNAGVVLGPQRAVAWRVLDAQYFGVAQRRRRVFVVASARRGFDPAQVLFEFDGVRRDTAPSREARQTAPSGSGSSASSCGPAVGVCPTLRAGGNQTGGDRPPGTDVDTADSLIITMAHGQGGAEIGFDRGPCLTCNHEAPIAAIPSTTHTLRGEGFDASEDGTGRGTPLVPVCHVDTMPTMTAGGPAASSHNQTSGQMRDQYIVPVMDAGVRYANYSHDYANDRITDPSGINPALTARTTASGNLNVLAPVAFPANLSGTQCASTEDLAPAMGAKNPTGVAYTTKLHNTASNQAGKVYEEYTTSLDRSSPPPALLTAMQVRRLTPTECERLQGFPDGYTDIPWTEYQRIQKRAAKAGTSFESELKKRGKVLRGPNMPACPDGPRYKALGNSWAVPNVRWIGARINAWLEAEYAREFFSRWSQHGVE